MISGSILLIFIAILVFFNTSKKAELSSNTSLERWIQNNTNYSKISGCLLLICALFLIIYSFGITSGILFWLIMLMSILSLIIVIFPLKKVTYKHLTIVFLLLLIFEFTL